MKAHTQIGAQVNYNNKSEVVEYIQELTDNKLVRWLNKCDFKYIFNQYLFMIFIHIILWYSKFLTIALHTEILFQIYNKKHVKRIGGVPNVASDEQVDYNTAREKEMTSKKGKAG